MLKCMFYCRTIESRRRHYTVPLSITVTASVRRPKGELARSPLNPLLDVGIEIQSPRQQRSFQSEGRSAEEQQEAQLSPGDRAMRRVS